MVTIPAEVVQEIVRFKSVSEAMRLVDATEILANPILAQSKMFANAGMVRTHSSSYVSKTAHISASETAHSPLRRYEDGDRLVSRCQVPRMAQQH